MSSSESRPFCLELNLFRKRTVFDHFHWDNAYGTIPCTGDVLIFSLGFRRWSQEWTKEWWPCWLNFGPLVAKYGGFRPLSDKVFKQSNSNLWCTLLGWVFITDLLLSHIGPILAFIRQKKTYWKWWFPTIIWHIIPTIQFKLLVYTSWVSVQDWFTFGHVGPILGLWWTKNYFQGFIIWKGHSNNFKFGVCIC